MTADLAAAQQNLAHELARRIAPTILRDRGAKRSSRPGSSEFWWIFEDVAEDRIELYNALVFAVDRVLQELNEPLRVITGAP